MMFLAVDAQIKPEEISAPVFLFNEIVCKVGPVEQIMSDQGDDFESNIFKHLCMLIGSEKIRSSAFQPSGNGGIEIVNKFIKPNLAKYVAESHDDWGCLVGISSQFI
jgi:hypothetical protein